MAKWLSLPDETLFYQPAQQAFLEARRQRLCHRCKLEYSTPPHVACPRCAKLGQRMFDRLTIIAGRRFGKSRIGAIAAVEEATIPNSIVWCCAPTNPKLHRYVIPALQQLIPEDWVAPGGWSAEFLDLRLTNGSLIHFQTLEDPDQGRGQGLDALWIDEVCELTKDHWEVIRPSLAGNTVAFFTTSPRSFDWVYEELYKPAEEGLPGYWACHAQTADSANPRITEEFLAREREQMSDLMFRQEYMADFVTFTGAVYGDLITNRLLHTTDAIKRFIPEWPDIAPWRQVVVGLDTGADHPFGGCKLVATELGLVVVGEYLERNKSFLEHASALKQLAKSETARWALNKNEKQGMIELSQHGIHNLFPAQNDVVAGIERVKSMLHKGELWFAVPMCHNTVKQMQAYRWAENTSPKDGAARKERVYKKQDELPDCIRYAAMTWTTPFQSAPKVDDRRDLSKLPDDMRNTIERMRRYDDREKIPELNSVGDFYA